MGYQSLLAAGHCHHHLKQLHAELAFEDYAPATGVPTSINEGRSFIHPPEQAQVDKDVQCALSTQPDAHGSKRHVNVSMLTWQHRGGCKAPACSTVTEGLEGAILATAGCTICD